MKIYSRESKYFYNKRTFKRNHYKIWIEKQFVKKIELKKIKYGIQNKETNLCLFLEVLKRNITEI